MRRRRWRRRTAGWALALLAAGAVGWVGLERLRPPLLIRVTAQEQREAVQAVAQAEAPRVLIYHTHTYEAYLATETENYKPTEKWRTRDENHKMIAVGDALAVDGRRRATARDPAARPLAGCAEVGGGGSRLRQPCLPAAHLGARRTTRYSLQAQ